MPPRSSSAEPLDDATAALERKDYVAAVELLRPLAEQGNTFAQVNLAFLTFEGDGVDANAARGREMVSTRGRAGR